MEMSCIQPACCSPDVVGPTYRGMGTHEAPHCKAAANAPYGRTSAQDLDHRNREATTQPSLNAAAI